MVGGLSIFETRKSIKGPVGEFYPRDTKTSALPQAGVPVLAPLGRDTTHPMRGIRVMTTDQYREVGVYESILETPGSRLLGSRMLLRLKIGQVNGQ
jgi:hypothetical protein